MWKGLCMETCPKELSRADVGDGARCANGACLVWLSDSSPQFVPWYPQNFTQLLPLLDSAPLPPFLPHYLTASFLLLFIFSISFLFLIPLLFRLPFSYSFSVCFTDYYLMPIYVSFLPILIIYMFLFLLFLFSFSSLLSFFTGFFCSLHFRILLIHLIFIGLPYLLFLINIFFLYLFSLFFALLPLPPLTPPPHLLDAMHSLLSVGDASTTR